jgi:leader peptidase (prepilin peptidase)/N-methyltransferase
MMICFGMWIAATLFLFLYSGFKTSTAVAFLLVTIQLISAINDIYSRSIPIKLIAFFLLAGLVIFVICYSTGMLANCVLGGTIGFGVIKLTIIMSGRQVGGGDLALITITGFYSGLKGFINILFISVVLAGIYSLLLVITKKGSRKTEIPFAPFVQLSTVILLISG